MNEIQRRKELRRRKRQFNTLQYWWRLLIIGSIGGGTISLTTTPIWTIKHDHQVTITGNKYITNQAIEKLLDFQYPQSLISISPQKVSDRLMSSGLFHRVDVTRQLIPPQITINLVDLPPVALIEHPKGSTPVKLITHLGGSFPTTNYQQNQLPKLKLLTNQGTTCPNWLEIYSHIITTIIPITTIDCIDPLNISLHTNIGKVRIGAYGKKFPEQIKQLEQLQTLQQQVPPEEIEYIDLENPSYPRVQVKLSEKLLPPSSSPPPPKQ
jgi:cell division protein FtsQ